MLINIFIIRFFVFLIKCNIIISFFLLGIPIVWKYIPIKFCIYLELNLITGFYCQNFDFFYCWIGEAIIIILIYRIDMLTIWWFGVKQKYRDIIFWTNNLNKNRLNFIKNPIFVAIDLTDYLYIIEITTKGGLWSHSNLVSKELFWNLWS